MTREDMCRHLDSRCPAHYTDMADPAQWRRRGAGDRMTLVGRATGQSLTVLGIETSCDETAAGLVSRSSAGKGRILADIVHSQSADHAPFGGIVPEIAARAHVALIDTVIAAALADAGLGFDDIDAVAATAGPGLIGGVLVGLTTAKAIAYAHGRALLAINHLEGHALTARLTHGLDFPYVLLLVSGGHTQILVVRGVGDYQRLGTTLDDALGEAFDKTAKLIGLGYPGGPEVERWAERGDAGRFDLPRPMLGAAEAHFSFSGLKTALRRRAEALAPLSERDVADLCAAFQEAAIDVVADRTERAIELMRARKVAAGTLVVAGGVAANRALARRLAEVALRHGLDLVIPPARLCTDNGAMIAWAGAERLALGLSDGLDAPARARWPLDPDAPAAAGAGVKA
jgi:N6-L-threonylcarbamoyladenine synthase